MPITNDAAINNGNKKFTFAKIRFLQLKNRIN
jgi:hypothetical protein